MHRIEFNLPNGIYSKLTDHFSPAEYDEAVKQALANYLEDIEDIKIAEERMAEPGEDIPIEELEKRLGLEN